jgi:hypothetical protein
MSNDENEPREIPGRHVIEALLTALIAGLYIACFYTMNNLTMLRLDGILVIFGLMVVPVVTLVLAVSIIFHFLRREERIPALVVFLMSAFLLYMLHPALIGLDSVRRYYELFADNLLLAKFLLIAFPSLILAFFFQKNLRIYAGALALMTVTSLVERTIMLNNEPSPLAKKQGLEKYLQDVVLEEKPNIYFILVDGFASFAFMNDHGIDVSDFSSQLEESGFILYPDTYSNYQPTTAAMPAMLNMGHHYYTLNESRAHFSEVSRVARQVIGGDNNVSHVLRNNGYSIQYIHQRNYLLMQGCSADSCYPEFDPLHGARLLFSHIFKRDLLVKEDRVTKSFSIEDVESEVSRLLKSSGNSPHFQYIHVFYPNHSPNNVAGHCDEEHELESYAARVKTASEYLLNQINEILEHDPDAVLILASDHGPFISNACAPLGFINTVEDYRDRAGMLTAIRWPSSYRGEFDDRIATGVNLFRFVLASLTDNDEVLLKSAARDDVFIRDPGLRVYRIIDNGRPVPGPQAMTIESR